MAFARLLVLQPVVQKGFAQAIGCCPVVAVEALAVLSPDSVGGSGGLTTRAGPPHHEPDAVQVLIGDWMAADSVLAESQSAVSHPVADPWDAVWGPGSRAAAVQPLAPATSNLTAMRAFAEQAPGAVVASGPAAVPTPAAAGCTECHQSPGDHPPGLEEAIHPAAGAVDPATGAVVAPAVAPRTVALAPESAAFGPAPRAVAPAGGAVASAPGSDPRAVAFLQLSWGFVDPRGPAGGPAAA